jgi:hypothetical protein
MHEIGFEAQYFEAQYEVYTEVSRLTGRDPLVVDADDLMNRSAATIKSVLRARRYRFPAVRPELAAVRPARMAALRTLVRRCGGQLYQRRLVVLGHSGMTGEVQVPTKTAAGL